MVVLTAAAPALRIRMSRREKSFEVELRPPSRLLFTDISSPTLSPPVRPRQTYSSACDVDRPSVSCRPDWPFGLHRLSLLNGSVGVACAPAETWRARCSMAPV